MRWHSHRNAEGTSKIAFGYGTLVAEYRNGRITGEICLDVFDGAPDLPWSEPAHHLSTASDLTIGMYNVVVKGQRNVFNESSRHRSRINDSGQYGLRQSIKDLVILPEILRMKSPNSGDPPLVSNRIEGCARQVNTDTVVGRIEANFIAHGKIEQEGLAGRLEDRLASSGNGHS